METRNVLVPQMGEGLQEVRIISFAKQPGEFVNCDDILYSMETDKATMEVESPYEGILVEWLAAEGEVLPIGAPIARIDERNSTTGAPVETAAIREENFGPGRIEIPQTRAAESAPVPSSTETREGAKRISPLAAASGAPLIPPRTRAYCKELGIGEEEMRQIHAPTGKLMPADIDAYLHTPHDKSAPVIAVTKTGTTQKTPTSNNGARKPAPQFSEKELSQAQRTFIMRIKRSQQVVVPAVIKRSVDWSTVRRVAEARKLFGDVSPTTFQTFSYAVAQAAKEHPKLRSTLPSDEKVREYEHVNIGIAVGLPSGQLNLAVVSEADALSYDDFISTAQANIEAARGGRDQANESVQLLLTYMGGYEIEDAIPLLVAPAIAILFIGSAFEVDGKPRVNLTLTFDHRLIQGIDAAEFMKTVAHKAENIETWRI